MENLINSKPKKNKSPFKDGSFIKEKILDMYGIKNIEPNSIAEEQTIISEIFPHESDKD